MVFIEEGNPKMIPDTGLVNFRKCRMMAHALQKIAQFQSSPYNLEALPMVSEPLKAEMDRCSKIDKSSKDVFYDTSMKLEGRGEDISDTKRVSARRRRAMLGGDFWGKGGSGEPIARNRASFVEEKILRTRKVQRKSVVGLRTLRVGAGGSSYAFFDQPDSPSNIVMSNYKNGAVVMSATLPKLVERLTYHVDQPASRRVYSKTPCDICSKPVNGTLYRCVNKECGDDICTNCIGRALHPLDHGMFLQLTPDQAPPSALEFLSLSFEQGSSHEVECSRCGVDPIRGFRLRCLTCGENLCPACSRLAFSAIDDVSHVFVQVFRPLTAESDAMLPFVPALPCAKTPGNRERRTLSAFLLVSRHPTSFFVV
jgi:hypothetical protein